MTDEIKVHVVKYPDRENFVLRFRDPQTGKLVTKSAETTKRSEADKAAGKWQAELREGRYAKRSRMLWDDFRDYYLTHAIAGLAGSSIMAYESTLNAFEAACSPQKLGDVTTSRITGFATNLRSQKLSEATVARHLRHLKAAMRWAHREGLLTILPQFTMPKRAKGAKVMRGRAITAEEFERMLAAVPKGIEARPVVGGSDPVTAWRFYLHALWQSGLRLSESLTLRWDNAPGSIVVDFSGRRPMLRIPAEAEKGFQDRTLPMTPDFARLLMAVPERDRRGRVFKLTDSDGGPFAAKRWDVGRVLSTIGKAAGVIVDERSKGDKTIKKFASAHDLRRAFGFRWATRVMPAVLKDLMRHEDVGTTMKYYVGQNAEAMADAIWASESNVLGNTDSRRDTAQKKTPANPGVSMDRGGIEPPTPGFSVRTDVDDE